MVQISLFSSFVFVMQVVIFVDCIWYLWYNYVSYVDLNSLRTWSPVCNVVDILVNPVMLLMQITVTDAYVYS